MKKLMAVFFVVAVVTALFCGVTAFAAAEPATVVADEGWASATYDAETQILTNVSEGYSFKWTGGSSLDYNGTTPITVENVVFPSSVNGVSITTINQYPFGSGNTVKNVIFSEGITKFNKSGFRNYGVETVRLPSTMTTLGQEVFRGCGSLKSINIPYGVTKIDNLTFQSCYALKSLELPETVTSFGQGAFAGSGLESIVIPSGVSSIAKECFKQCSSLKTITFKGNITKVGADAFRLAPSLESIIFEGNTETAPAYDSSNNGCPINSDSKNLMNVTIYYQPSAAASFEDSEYAATWTGNNATISMARIQGEQGGCSISAMAAEGADTTVTYSAVDTNNNASVVVLIALYNGDVMIGAKTVSMNETTATFTGVTGATKARIFMWNSLASATPLYESFEY